MKVAAIIPAYNEERTIRNVIQVLQKMKLISEIVVVNDGSTDRTKDAVENRGKVRLIELPKNRGKGAALITGSRFTDADILLFLDADLLGLTTKHVEDLVRPVLRDEADMTRGVFTDGRKTTDLSHKIAPGISGQRAIKRKIIEKIPNLEKTRFGFEVVLNRYIKKKKLRMLKVKLLNLTHIMKEEKFGLKKGFQHRMKMYWEILRFIGNPKKGRL